MSEKKYLAAVKDLEAKEKAFSEALERLKAVNEAIAAASDDLARLERQREEAVQRFAQGRIPQSDLDAAYEAVASQQRVITAREAAIQPVQAVISDKKHALVKAEQAALAEHRAYWGGQLDAAIEEAQQAVKTHAKKAWVIQKRVDPSSTLTAFSLLLLAGMLNEESPPLEAGKVPSQPPQSALLSFQDRHPDGVDLVYGLAANYR